MVNVIMVIIVIFIITAIGGGGAYILWLITRPKKLTWLADVYQPGEGIKPYIRNDNGEIINKIKLSDLKPYTQDIIERIEEAHGVVIYRLKKLNKTVPAVTTDCVDYWGEKKKRVSVLLDQGTCTILTKGYDRDTARILFKPMPHDRINMIKGEMSLQLNRLKKEKDLLAAVTPWVITGIAFVGLIAIAYIIVNGYQEISKENNVAIDRMSQSIDKFSSRLLILGKIFQGEQFILETSNISIGDPPGG